MHAIEHFNKQLGGYTLLGPFKGRLDGYRLLIPSTGLVDISY